MVFIATYVISDIHGQYDMFMELIDKIDLKQTDTLYVLGDILDRGPHPIKVLKKLMEMPNAICIVGNHELMALECLEILMKEITDMSIEELDEEMLDNLVTWQYNGSKSTIDEFSELGSDEKQDIIDFIKEFLIYEEVAVSERDYLLVHAGLGNYSPEKDIEDYSPRLRRRKRDGRCFARGFPFCPAGSSNTVRRRTPCMRRRCPCGP